MNVLILVAVACADTAEVEPTMMEDEIHVQITTDQVLQAMEQLDKAAPHDDADEAILRVIGDIHGQEAVTQALEERERIRQEKAEEIAALIVAQEQAEAKAMAEAAAKAEVEVAELKAKIEDSKDAD